MFLAAAAAAAAAGGPLASLDYDGDGLVTADGAVAARMESFFAADKDGDARLSEAEYGDMMSSALLKLGRAPAAPERGQVDPFTFADKDADGYVTAPEFRDVTRKLVQSLDKDGDGFIALEAAAGN